MHSKTLSEAASKIFLTPFAIPFASERNCATEQEAVDAALAIGFPVVVKLSGDAIAHKTERGLVQLHVKNSQGVQDACSALMQRATPDDGEVSFLVAEMVKGDRELIVGIVKDPQFGHLVALGVGGIFAEAIDDVQLRPIPITREIASDMIASLEHQSILGNFRGSQQVDRIALCSILMSLSEVCQQVPNVNSLDINPLIIRDNGSLVAVDALVELFEGTNPSPTSISSFTPTADHFAALFNPRAVVIVGASSHPGKFGFVSLHNVLANQFRGEVFATNLQQENVLGIQTVANISQLPNNTIDLAFFCTPSSANEDLLTECAAIGIKSVFIASAGYRESGSDGERAEASLLKRATELNIMIVGPNGQGIVSTPPSLCAQIVAPYPPQGAISIASQSGNFVSSFLNYSRQSGVGVARAVSAGNAAQIGIHNFLQYFSTDSETAVALTYIENVDDGGLLIHATRTLTALKPLVVLKGGSTEAGSRAAQSHTGAMASSDRVFSGVLRAVGATKVSSVEEAFEVAASFSTQPLPQGNRVAILTTVGGWGVVTADALAQNGVLTLSDLPDDLMDQLSELLPSRWSKNNPIDCAGGETRDTIIDIMEIVTAHHCVDAVIFLGIGIQSNQARMMREGHFYPDHGLERIVAYHEKQDERYAEQAQRVSRKYAKPVLIATELAIADPQNAGPRAVRQTGSYCYPTGARAIACLAHMYEYAKFRGVAT